MKRKLYIVFSNRSAREMWIAQIDYDSDWTYQRVGGAYSTNEFESFDIKECKNFIKECRRASKEYLVLWDKYYDEVWIEKWDCCSGTFQKIENETGGSIQRRFDTKEEAEKYIEKLNN